MNSTPDRTSAHRNRLGPALLAAISLPLLAATGLGAEVGENWTKHCASCHGKDGKGQTKAGRMAGVKDQTDAQYQAGLKDEKMFTSIKEGLKEAEKDKMKPFKDKLSDEEIKALVAHVRSFKK
jgi:cytochrome c553